MMPPTDLAPVEPRLAVRIILKLQKMWLVKSSATFVTMGLLRGVSQFAFVMVMTRLMLPADYGIYSNFLYITAILSPLFFLKSDVPVARKYVAAPEDTAAYIGTIVQVCSLATLASGPALWFSQSTIQKLTGVVGAWQLLILVACWSYGLFLVVLAILQIQMRAWAIAFSRIFPAMTCELSAMALVFFLHGNWRTALTAYAGISALWGVGYLLWLRKHGLLRFNIRMIDLKDFLTVSVPLIPMSIGFMLVQISAQFILTHYSAPREVGIYAAANQFSLGVWLLAMSGQQAFLPWLFKILTRKNPNENYKIVAALAGITAILAVCTFMYVIVFRLFYPMVIGLKFADGVNLLQPLAWANFFLGVQMVLNCFLYHRKQTGISAIVACLAAACGLAMGIWRIPLGGARAAAHVTETSAALIALFTMVVVAWEFRDLFLSGIRDSIIRLSAVKR